jgi:hypothetical protein
MKTTQLTVEQVLVGLVVVLVPILPFVGFTGIEGLDAKDLGKVAGLVAFAYLVGLPFDRLADTILSSLDRQHRLRYQQDLDRPEPGNGLAPGAASPRSGPPPLEPFPRRWRQSRVMAREKKLTEWLGYLRSRVRLARSLAVYLPALTVSAVLAVLPRDASGSVRPADSSAPPHGGWTSYGVAMGAVFVAYAVAGVATAVAESRRRRERGAVPEEAAAITVDVALVAPAAFLVGAGVWLVSRAPGARAAVAAAAILVAGGAFSALASWTWWRIDRTLYEFLDDCERAFLEQDAARPSAER